MLEPGALVWGSDVPFSGGGIESVAGASAELRPRILGANALDTFARLRAETPVRS
jgi:hypothetical protein